MRVRFTMPPTLSGRPRHASRPSLSHPDLAEPPAYQATPTQGEPLTAIDGGSTGAPGAELGVPSLGAAVAESLGTGIAPPVGSIATTGGVPPGDPEGAGRPFGAVVVASPAPDRPVAGVWVGRTAVPLGTGVAGTVALAGTAPG